MVTTSSRFFKLLLAFQKKTELYNSEVERKNLGVIFHLFLSLLSTYRHTYLMWNTTPHFGGLVTKPDFYYFLEAIRAEFKK